MLTRKALNGIAFTAAVVGVLTLGLLISVRIDAQVVGATLSGTVTDPSGAAIPGAQISIRNTATGVTTSITADSAGFYTAPNLLPGTYDVTVTATGFATQVESGITLTVGAQQALNVTMKVGQTTEKIEVTGAAPTVQLATSAISAQVNSTTVRELPLNGRDWASLATLQPGVNAVETQVSFETGTGRGNRGFGAQLSISGGRPTQNNYRLDGISMNDYGNGAPGNVLGSNLGVDAIQEFSVITSNYTAEYGKTSGGVVNAITKSGTNQFHGSVYEFLRNSALDANDFLSNAGAVNRAPFRRNQFGADAGGPIRKDKTFIFGDYEAIRQSKGITLVDHVPSPAARAGNLADGSTITVDPSATKMLVLYPLPNGGINGDKGNYTFAGQQVITENFFTIRADHRISEKDSLFATYLYDDTPYSQPDSMNNYLVNTHTNRHIAVLEESHTFSPALVNSVRLGYNRAGVANFVGVSAINPASVDKSLATQPGQNAARVIMSGGFSVMNGGVNTISYNFHYWNSWQAYDDAFWTHGTHSVKFGFGFERMQYNILTNQNPGGTWRFSTLKDFLTNNPKSYESGLPTAISPRGMRQSIWAGYVQDDWRWRPNVTLNLGLRYEMATAIREVQGKFNNLSNLASPTLLVQSTQAVPTVPGLNVALAEPNIGTPFMKNPTLHNFEPRVGFSWDPFRNGKTAVRGGFGVFDVLPLPGYFILQSNQEAPFFLLGTVNSSAVPLAGTFFQGGAPLLGVNSLGASITDYDPKRNYTFQWNFNVQREITPTLTATVGYVGSHGVHMLIRGDDADMVLPQLTSAGYLFPFPAGSGTRINPSFGSERFIFWGTNSSYNGLELGLTKKMSHGLQAQASYTWGKALDNNSSTIAGDAFQNSVTTWFWFDPRISKAPADFNVRHTLVLNGLWQVPDPHSLGGVGNTLLRGWQVGGIFKWNDGVPTTITIGGDPMGVLNSNSDPFGLPDRIPGCNPINSNYKRDNLNYLNQNCYDLPRATAAIAAVCTPYPADFTGQTNSCQNLMGNGGRNGVYGPSLVNLDFSLVKNTPIRRISETFNVQFRAEFFNVLNHANFSPPGPFDTGFVLNEDGSLTNPGSAATSQLDTLVTTPREIQFALKLIW